MKLQVLPAKSETFQTAPSISLGFFCVILVCLSTLFACSKTKTNETVLKKDHAGWLQVETPNKLLSPDITELKATNKNILASTHTIAADDMFVDIWASELLVADPIALDIDNQGRVYFTRTHRQKNSEYDIRKHRDWENESFLLTSIEEKRQFLRKQLSSKLSPNNTWLPDLNGDGLHDWRDMRIEKEQVYRLEDSDNDGIADQSLLILEDFNDETTDVAGALLVNNEEVFVGVGPDMWRLKDSDKDGKLDKKQSLAKGFGIHIGYSGHGMSGAEIGPDGKIYWGIGDIGFHGKGRGPKSDLIDYSDRGVIVRSNPDGSDFEVFAMGVRNTHEFAFDKYGNLISVDNDGDHPGESERIVYITEGSDSGWRINWQLGKYRDTKNNTYNVWMDEEMYTPFFEGQAAHITPPIANYINGPTGMVYNPGTALSDKWKNTFFVAEFVGDPTRSGIHAFKLKPKGAGFELESSEKVLSGILATGLEFGNDGALYIADWLNGWSTSNSGRIWRLHSHKADSEANISNLTASDFSVLQDITLKEFLAHADQRIRHKAQFSLVNQSKDAEYIFTETLQNSPNQLARIHSIWGLTQLAQQNPDSAKVIASFINDKDTEIRAQAARWLGDLRFNSEATGIQALLEDPSPRVKFFAAEALGKMAYSPAAQDIVEMLKINSGEDRYLHHAGSLALARMDVKPLLLQLASAQEEALRLAAIVALRKIRAPEISLFLEDKSDWVLAETARAINDDASIPEALPALAAILNRYQGKTEAIIRRAINANLRLGKNENMQNLLLFARDESRPTILREEAVRALSTWSNPSIFDRVDGKYRGQKSNSPESVELAYPVLISLLNDSNASLRVISTEAIGRLRIKKAAPNLLEALLTDQSPNVRMSCLQNLALLKGSHLVTAIIHALGDSNSDVRSIALELLEKSKLNANKISAILAEVFDKGEHNEKQSAIRSFSHLDPSITRGFFENQIQQLHAREIDPKIVFELVKAIQLTQDETLNNSLQTGVKTWANTELQANYPGAAQGGDTKKGKDIFFWSQAASCTKCHSVEAGEVKAGPSLYNIGASLSPEELLQALVEPSARIAPGFGDGPSSMPPMHKIITLSEVRDLVSYLSSLNEDQINQ